MSLCNTFRRSAPLLALLLSSVFALPSAHAHSIDLSSSSGNTFSYDVIAQDGTVSFYGGSTISMDGFSGEIVNVTLSPLASNYGTVSFSNSAIVYTLNENQFYSWPTPADLPLFTVTTASNSLGQLFWTLNEATGSQSGTIDPTTNATTSGFPAPTVTVTPLPPATSNTNPAITVTNAVDPSPASPNTQQTYTNAIVATPEPSALILLGTGCVGAAGLLRRRIS